MSIQLAFSDTEHDAEDARRYRFLRDQHRLGHWRVQQWQVHDYEWEPTESYWETLDEKHLDATIDEELR